MKKFNRKIAPLFIAGGTIFLLGSAYKYIFIDSKKSKPMPKPIDQTTSPAATADDQAH